MADWLCGYLDAGQGQPVTSIQVAYHSRYQRDISEQTVQRHSFAPLIVQQCTEKAPPRQAGL